MTINFSSLVGLIQIKATIMLRFRSLLFPTELKLMFGRSHAVPIETGQTNLCVSLCMRVCVCVCVGVYAVVAANNLQLPQSCTLLRHKHTNPHKDQLQATD